jgi:hypothetical protein
MVYRFQEKRDRIPAVANSWSTYLCLHPTFFFETTECEANPPYMTIQCSPACLTCEQLDSGVICPFDRNDPTVWGPGDLNAMFEQIVASPANEQYTT